MADPLPARAVEPRGERLAWLIFCVAAAGLVPLLTRPFYPCGFNDDFSYTLTALQLLKTGRFVYNGWAAAMLGGQAYWGALFAWLFGPSFVSVRLSTLPLAAGCGGLIYALMSGCGLTPRRSAFVACAIMLSPMAIVLSASFMTDIPGLFGFLLPLWLASVALRSARDSTRLAAVTACAVTGVAAASVRQTNIIVTVVSLAVCAVRFHRPVLRAVCWVLAIAATLAYTGINDWYWRQPYSIHETVGNNVRLTLARPLYSAGGIVRFYFSGVLTVSPVILAGGWPRWRSWWLWLAALGVFGLTALLLYATPNDEPPLQIWRGNMISSSGVAPGGLPSSATFECNDNLLILIAIALLAVHGLLTVRLARFVFACWHRGGLAGAWNELPVVIQIWLLFSLIYVPLACTRAGAGGTFDRYVLPVVPFAGWCLLRHVHLDRWRVLNMRAGMVLCGGLACYGVVAADAYFRQLETRSAAEAVLVSRGVDTLDIRAGFEHDGLKQILASGRLNDTRLRPGEFDHILFNQAWGPMPYWWTLTPLVRTRYLLSGRPLPGFTVVPGMAIDYYDLFGNPHAFYVLQRPGFLHDPIRIVERP